MLPFSILAVSPDSGAIAAKLRLQQGDAKPGKIGIKKYFTCVLTSSVCYRL
jgi:hypothetical protein